MPTENTETKTSIMCNTEPPIGPKIPGEDPKGPAELTTAECCGNCVHSSKPKPAADHIAFYEVAKTERWCYKHNWHITRECVCQDFELEPKKGGVPACKRAFAFNKKAQEINELRQRMEDLQISYVYEGDNYMRYSIEKNKPYIRPEHYCTSKWNSFLGDSEPCPPYWESYSLYGPKDSKTAEFIKIIKEHLDNYEKTIGGKESND